MYELLCVLISNRDSEKNTSYLSEKERVSVCWTKSYSVREEHTETLNVNSREDRWTSYGR